MKKVLIITYYWPPSGGSGVQRWLKTSKYLPENGWTPIIYTPQNPDFDIKDDSLASDIHLDAIILRRPILEPYALARLFSKGKKVNAGLITTSKEQSLSSKLMNWVRGNIFIPDPRVWWVKPSIKYLSKYIKENQVDAIVTTGPPHSMHLIGLGLKKKFDIPWISDFRDPWSKLDFLDAFRLSPRALKKYEALEKEVLRNSDWIMFTSFSMPELFFDVDKSKVYIMTNGYDDSDFIDSNETTSRQSNIVVYHAGLLNEIRYPENLFNALELIQNEGEIEIQIHLVGNVDAQIKNKIQSKPALDKITIIEGYKPHQEVLQDYQKASHLLLLINDTHNSKVNIPGKLFEYLASNKTIIGIGKLDDDAITILDKFGHPHFQYDEEISLDSLKESLIRNTLVKDSRAYSRRVITKIFVHELLNNL